jgi:hypothetical protein
MGSSAIKRDSDSFGNLGLGQRSRLNQQNHVHQIPHAAVRRTLSWQGVGVKFFRKLLLAGDHVHRRARHTGKPQPITPFDHFERLPHNIAYPYV